MVCEHEVPTMAPSSNLRHNAPVRASTEGPVNVLLGWMGFDIPAIPRERHRPYRKTEQRRGPRHRKPQHQLTLG
jgi:hypothetical protein